MNGHFRCPLCGFQFEKQETHCVHGCPLGRFCKLVCCPNCQYEFTPDRQPLAWLQRWFHRHRRARLLTRIVGVDELCEGEMSELVVINSAQPHRRNALAVYGLVPGSQLVLQQKYPSYVIRVGETELALEREIAQEIQVRRL